MVYIHTPKILSNKQHILNEHLVCGRSAPYHADIKAYIYLATDCSLIQMFAKELCVIPTNKCMEMYFKWL